MTDKVQKIREEVEKIARSTNPYIPDEEGKNSEYEAGRLAMAAQILQYIDSMQEEPVSENLSEKELAESYLAVFDKKYQILPTLKGEQLADFKNFLNKCQQEFGLKEYGIHPTQAKLFEKLTLLWATWGAEHLQGIGRQDEKEQDIPVSEDLIVATNNYCVDVRKGYPRVMDETDRYICNAFKAGAKWQKENLWKPAYGDDLPEIDREVIVLTQPYPLEDYEFAVSFAHRPDPKGWDGKSITTGEVEHYTPKTYDKGGWNIPNVAFWLDLDIPKL